MSDYQELSKLNTIHKNHGKRKVQQMKYLQGTNFSQELSFGRFSAKSISKLPIREIWKI